MSYWSEGPDGVLLLLHCLPNAPKTQVIGIHGEALKMKIHAPPVDGKANDEIVRFFADQLGIARNRVSIEAGGKSKGKKLRIQGLTWTEIKTKLSLP